METKKSTKIVILVIGSLAILAGFYSLFKGNKFEDYWLSFFSGIVLIGTLFIEQEKQTKLEKDKS